MHSLAVRDWAPLHTSFFYDYNSLCLKYNKVPQLYLEHNGSLPKILNSLKLHFKKFRHTNAVGTREILITHLNSEWKIT